MTAALPSSARNVRVRGSQVGSRAPKAGNAKQPCARFNSRGSTRVSSVIVRSSCSFLAIPRSACLGDHAPCSYVQMRLTVRQIRLWSAMIRVPPRHAVLLVAGLFVVQPVLHAGQGLVGLPKLGIGAGVLLDPVRIGRAPVSRVATRWYCSGGWCEHRLRSVLRDPSANDRVQHQPCGNYRQ